MTLPFYMYNKKSYGDTCQRQTNKCHSAKSRAAAEDAYNRLYIAEEKPFILTCEDLGDCDEDSPSTGARKAPRKTTFQNFTDALDALNAERSSKSSTGISTVRKQYGLGLNIAPNPAQEFTILTVNSLKTTKHAHILHTDITGKVLQRIDIQSAKVNYQIFTTNYSKGFYHVCLYEDGAQTDCKKLIIN